MSDKDAVTRLNAALEGRYRIERQLGEGGMATVYLADDLRHERKVAVKVLRPELAAVVGADRFLAEIKTTAKLQHPHILPLFDSGEADSFLFYVMPYVEGESLREKLDRENQLGVDEALGLAKKVAGALEHAHDNGVVHRDIKPGNILLSRQGEPLVADFGIALAVAQAGGGRITETGLSLGTPHYMSPEQATGDRDVDPRSDVYALACVLYEMLAGEPPFSASTAQAILAKILTMDAPSITMVRRTVPQNVGAALAKALEKLPADRFTSVASFAAALDDDGFRYRARTRDEREAAHAVASASAWQRNRWLTPLGLGLATTAFFAALAAWGWLRPAPEFPPGDVVRFPLTPPEELGMTRDGPLRDLAISRDGRLVAYTGRGPNGPQLYLWALSELSGAPLRGAEGGTGPFFSPDGQWVGFVNVQNENAIQRVPMLGGAPVTLATAPARVQGASWSLDGTIVLGTGAGIYRVPEGGGEPEALTTLRDGAIAHYWPDVIEGRGAVVFTLVGGGMPMAASSLAVLDLASGEVTELGIQGFAPRYVPTGHLVYGAGDGSLRAIPFDIETLSVSGTTVPLIEGLLVKPSSAADFDLSEGGRLVYATGGVGGDRSPRSVLWVDRTGREEPIEGITPRPYGYPRLSPDGLRLALEVRDERVGLGAVWIWDFERRTETRLLGIDDTDFSFPAWSLDGSRLVYSERGNRDIRWRTYNNTGVPSVLLEDIGGEGRQQPEVYFFTPDGEHVVLRQMNILDRGDDLMMVPITGGEPEWELRESYNERNAELSPDGRWMAYNTDESGRYEIYVSPFPDVGSDKVQVSTAGGQKPRWSWDGNELFYIQQPAELNQLMSVAVEPVAPGESFRFGTRQPVIDWPYWNGAQGRSFDVSPDGQRFIAIERSGLTDEAGSPQMMVVLNWFEELRERTGSN